MLFLKISTVINLLVSPTQSSNSLPEAWIIFVHNSLYGRSLIYSILKDRVSVEIKFQNAMITFLLIGPLKPRSLYHHRCICKHNLDGYIDGYELDPPTTTTP